MTGDLRGIYARHRGPFQLGLTYPPPANSRRVSMGVSKWGKDRDLSAEDAHEEARMLVNDPRDDVLRVHVWSNTEQQFIGAVYERGKMYPAWDDDAIVDGSDEVAAVPREPVFGPKKELTFRETSGSRPAPLTQPRRAASGSTSGVKDDTTMAKKTAKTSKKGGKKVAKGAAKSTEPKAPRAGVAKWFVDKRKGLPEKIKGQRRAIYDAVAAAGDEGISAQDAVTAAVKATESEAKNVTANYMWYLSALKREGYLRNDKA